MLEKWENVVDAGIYIIMVFIGLSKAFGTLNQAIFGVHFLMKNYLAEQQKICVNKNFVTGEEIISKFRKG